MFLNDSRNVFEVKFHQVAYSILEPFFECSFFVFDWRKKKQLVCHCFPISAKSPSSSSLCCSENAATEAHVQYTEFVNWKNTHGTYLLYTFICRRIKMQEFQIELSQRQLSFSQLNKWWVVCCFENYNYECTSLSPRAFDAIIRFLRYLAIWLIVPRFHCY